MLPLAKLRAWPRAAPGQTSGTDVAISPRQRGLAIDLISELPEVLQLVEERAPTNAERLRSLRTIEFVFPQGLQNCFALNFIELF